MPERRKDGAVIWECLCDCGNTHYASTTGLKNGKVKSCGCLQKEVASQREDLTGKKYNSLLVLGPDKDNMSKYKWICQCDCGNIVSVSAYSLKTGHTKSCGCYSKQRRMDTIGKKYNMLTILELVGNKFKCKCDCGNEKLIDVDKVISGYTKSCGCYKKNYNRHFKPNDRVGILTLIEDTKKRDRHGGIIWKCLCDCGNYCEASTDILQKEQKLSCGCMKQSKGEYLIEQLLKENNIEYKTEQCLIKDRKFRFDFYVENSYVIEFDGIQHFEYKNNNGWNNEENFIKTKANDEIKNEWCK